MNNFEEQMRSDLEEEFVELHERLGARDLKIEVGRIGGKTRSIREAFENSSQRMEFLFDEVSSIDSPRTMRVITSRERGGEWVGDIQRLVDGKYVNERCAQQHDIFSQHFTHGQRKHMALLATDYGKYLEELGYKAHRYFNGRIWRLGDNSTHYLWADQFISQAETIIGNHVVNSFQNYYGLVWNVKRMNLNLWMDYDKQERLEFKALLWRMPGSKETPLFRIMRDSATSEVRRSYLEAKGIAP